MASTKTLEDLFLDTLKDVYYAEQQILKALPKMVAAAESEKLRTGMERHLHQTEGQVERLEQVFNIIGEDIKGKRCDAIEGIIAEGDEIMKEYAGTPALDAGLIAAAQAVEHYEISRYGTLKRWAEVLGYNDAVPLLNMTLEQEEATDDLLTVMAEEANDKAADGLEDEEETENDDA